MPSKNLDFFYNKNMPIKVKGNLISVHWTETLIGLGFMHFTHLTCDNKYIFHFLLQI